MEDRQARISFGKKTIYKGSRALQGKCGYGTLDRLRIKEAKKDIAEADYWPFAVDRIAAIGLLVKEVRSDGNNEEFIDDLIKIVVHLKSTASTFGYEVISDLTSIMLEFLELTQEFDHDVIDIIEGHQKTLSYLVHADIKSTSEEECKALKQELYEACRRYRTKKNQY